MRMITILSVLIFLAACVKDDKLREENNSDEHSYSQWNVYDSIEGYVYFKINSLALNSNNKIYFSAFVRKDWNSANYNLFSFVSNAIKEIDTSIFFRDYNLLEDDLIKEKIWFNTELMFVDYKKTDTYCFVTDIMNKRRSSPHQIDSKGNIWISSEDYYYSNSDGIQMYDGKNWHVFFEGTDFWSLCFDETGNIYFSTLPDFETPGIVMKYDYKKWDTVLICSEAAKWIPCMHFDVDNNLWCGVLSRFAVSPKSGDGLYKYDGVNITHYNINNSKLPSNSVIDIAIDKHNNKWIASYSGGLTKLTPEGVWKSFNSSNTPMTNMSIECVVVDNDDNIWIADDIGLIKFKE